jgi:hypothetical protein
MRQAAPGKSITYDLVVAIGMSFLFQEVAFSASRSFRRSGKFRASAMHSWHRLIRLPAQMLALCWTGARAAPFRFQLPARSRIWVHWKARHRCRRRCHHQLRFSAFNPSREVAPAGTYIYPQWVDGGRGVEISRPGYWSDMKQRIEEER